MELNFLKKKEKTDRKSSLIPKPGFIKDLILKGQLARLIVIIFTVVFLIFFLILAFISSTGGLKGVGSPIDFVIFALLSGTGFFGLFEALRIRRIHKIDQIFPDFLRDLASSKRAGMTFAKSIMFTSKGSYGMLTPEIKKISQQISWGTSITDALHAFSQRVNTKSIRRSVSLIIESSKSGGNVTDVLSLAADDARELKMLEEERRVNMSSYVIVIYVSMFVFLAIMVILNLSFIPAMIGTGAQGLASIMSGGSTGQSVEILSVFYLATLVQGIGSGVVAGVFEDGSLYSGVKHVFILTLVSWITFKFMLGI
jgi:flagellar protein FlaJ